jgi:steroid delta-isomerase
MATADQIRTAFERYAAAMSAGDTEAVIALFSDDAYLEDPVGGERTAGIDAVRQHFTAATQQSSSKLEIIAPVRVVEPGYGAAAMTSRTEMGDQVYLIDIIDVFTFDDDGLITSMTAYWGPTNVAMEA